MSKLQKNIATRLKSLRELGDVTVTVTKSLGRIKIEHRRQHVANFRFTWVKDSHYIGRFVDDQGKNGQAIVSIWEPIEAVKFMVAYSTLVELGARRPKPTK